MNTKPLRYLAKRVHQALYCLNSGIKKPDIHPRFSRSTGWTCGTWLLAATTSLLFACQSDFDSIVPKGPLNGSACGPEMIKQLKSLIKSKLYERHEFQELWISAAKTLECERDERTLDEFPDEVREKIDPFYKLVSTAQSRAVLPALVEVLILQDFTYTRVPSPSGLVIEGKRSHLEHAESPAILASAEFAEGDRWELLKKYQQLFCVVQPESCLSHTKIEECESETIGDAQEDDSWKRRIDCAIGATWGWRTLWLEKHMPYVTTYLWGLEFRVHTRKSLTTDGHIVEYRELITIRLPSGETALP